MPSHASLFQMKFQVFHFVVNMVKWLNSSVLSIPIYLLFTMCGLHSSQPMPSSDMPESPTTQHVQDLSCEGVVTVLRDQRCNTSFNFKPNEWEISVHGTPPSYVLWEIIILSLKWSKSLCTIFKTLDWLPILHRALVHSMMNYMNFKSGVVDEE